MSVPSQRATTAWRSRAQGEADRARSSWAPGSPLLRLLGVQKPVMTSARPGHRRPVPRRLQGQRSVPARHPFSAHTSPHDRSCIFCRVGLLWAPQRAGCCRSGGGRGNLTLPPGSLGPQASSGAGRHEAGRLPSTPVCSHPLLLSRRAAVTGDCAPSSPSGISPPADHGADSDDMSPPPSPPTCHLLSPSKRILGPRPLEANSHSHGDHGQGFGLSTSPRRAARSSLCPDPAARPQRAAAGRGRDRPGDRWPGFAPTLWGR